MSAITEHYQMLDATHWFEQLEKLEAQADEVASQWNGDTTDFEEEAHRANEVALLASQIKQILLEEYHNAS